jgi:hypothetical protein
MAILASSFDDLVLYGFFLIYWHCGFKVFFTVASIYHDWIISLVGFGLYMEKSNQAFTCCV